MTVDSLEYYGLLYKIQENNAPSLAVLVPGKEPMYEIDLDSRTITAPEFLSIETDHRSETVYFKVARYYDNIDLSQLACVIQYINANGDGRIYPVPYYDVDTYHEDDMMLFPWLIDGEATKKAGTVQFSVRFFEVDSTGTYLLYNLNTLPAEGKVKHGIEFKYDEIYKKVNLNSYSYKKNKYYYINAQGVYTLAVNDFDQNLEYYEKTVLNQDATDYTASFLEQMVHYAQQAANNDLYWILL